MVLLPSQHRLMRALRVLMALDVVTLAFGSWYLSLGQLRLFAEIYSVLVLAMMWTLLAGYADIVTVGQHAFVGLGAYALYECSVKAQLGVPLSMVAAGLFSFLIGIPIMAVVFRLRAAYLAIGTWVVAEVCTLLARRSPDSARQLASASRAGSSALLATRS